MQKSMVYLIWIRLQSPDNNNGTITLDMNLGLLGSISDVSALTGDAQTIWTAVLALGIAMVGYRIGKRIIGRF